MRPRISIRGFVRLSIRPSVRPSVRPLVSPSVGHMFLKYHGKHHGTHRIAFLVEIQENSAKFKKIQQFIGRIVVRIELVPFQSQILIPSKKV